MTLLMIASVAAAEGSGVPGAMGDAETVGAKDAEGIGEPGTSDAPGLALVAGGAGSSDEGAPLGATEEPGAWVATGDADRAGAASDGVGDGDGSRVATGLVVGDGSEEGERVGSGVETGRGDEVAPGLSPTIGLGRTVGVSDGEVDVSTVPGTEGDGFGVPFAPVPVPVGTAVASGISVAVAVGTGTDIT
jgi:hypothetical protein